MVLLAYGRSASNYAALKSYSLAFHGLFRLNPLAECSCQNSRESDLKEQQSLVSLEIDHFVAENRCLKLMQEGIVNCTDKQQIRVFDRIFCSGLWLRLSSIASSITT